MSFLEHLGELRRRILWSLLAILVCFIPAYYFSSRLFDFLMEPIRDNLPQGSTLIFTMPAEGFMTYLKVSFLRRLPPRCRLSSIRPGNSLRPGLYKHEKQIAIPFIFFGTLFFAFGASFCYYVAAPPGVRVPPQRIFVGVRQGVSRP